MNHGVSVRQQATSLSAPVVADSGLPYVVGTAPVWTAENPAKAFEPVLCTSYDEAVSRLGYSDDWESYTLCEFLYSHFRLYNCQPVIFCNVLDSLEPTETAPADMEIAAHKVKLPLETLPDTVILKPSGGDGEAYLLDTDYSLYYSGENLIAEALPDGAMYTVATVNVSYSKISASDVSTADIAEGIDKIDQCVSLFGTVPDLICAPGFSGDSAVAALMAAKAGGFNDGLFRAKALIDVDADSYAEAIQQKGAKNLIDENQILCWPMLRLGEKRYRMSTQLAGLLAQIDSDNGGVPYESPSNKNFQCDGAVLPDGSEVNLTHAQANQLNANGIATALRFFNGWTCWGNDTACYPANTDVKDRSIPVSRMFGWVGTTLIRTFWSKIDKPMVRRTLDNILDTANIWLNGLVSSGYILGGRVEFSETENPTTDLLSGILKFHIYLTPPTSAQEIQFVLEYDVDYAQSLFA